MKISMYLDWDKYSKKFYNNIYLEEFKLVIKMPLIHMEDNKEEDIKIKKFDLSKYTYLLSYE